MSTAQTLNTSNPHQEAQTVIAVKGAVNPGSAGGVKQTSGSDSALFVPGMSADTIHAMLAVMTILQEIANIYGQLLMQQADMEKELANNLANFTIKSADEDGDALIAQGVGGIVGSGISMTMIGVSMTGDSEVNEADANLKSAQSYRDLMDEREVPATIASDRPGALTEEEALTPSERQARQRQAARDEYQNDEVEKGFQSLKNKRVEDFSIDKKTGFVKRMVAGKQYDQVESK